MGGEGGGGWKRTSNIFFAYNMKPAALCRNIGTAANIKTYPLPRTPVEKEEEEKKRALWVSLSSSSRSFFSARKEGSERRRGEGGGGLSGP